MLTFILESSFEHQRHFFSCKAKTLSGKVFIAKLQ